MNSISIIVATYNAGKYLQNCLDSIILQKDEKIELLIIDGGSKDNTVEIIKNNQQYITYWISEPDKGIYDAWNKGILHSHGKWIAFVGADDVLKPDAIQRYKSFIYNLTDPHINFISAKAEVKDKQGSTIKIIGKQWHPIFINICHVMALHNHKLFELHGNYNTQYKIVGDYEFLLRCHKSIKPYFINNIICEVGNGGVSCSYRAITEIFKARIKTNQLNYFLIIILFIWDILIFTLNKWFKR